MRRCLYFLSMLATQKTIALLHCDGVNGSTYFKDEVGNPTTSSGIVVNTYVGVDRPQIGNGHGTGGGSIYITHNPSLNFIRGDFTFEAWLKNAGASQQVASKGQAAGSLGWQLKLGGVVSTDRVVFSYSKDGNNWISLDFGVPFGYTTSYTHLALVRDNQYIKCFKNGILLGTPAFIGNDAIYNNEAALAITPGASGVDEIRVSRSARYTTNFTPQTIQFEVD